MPLDGDAIAATCRTNMRCARRRVRWLPDVALCAARHRRRTHRAFETRGGVRASECARRRSARRVRVDVDGIVVGARVCSGLLAAFASGSLLEAR